MSLVLDDDCTLLSIPEAAAILGVAKATVRRLIAKGRMAAVAHGGRFLIAEEEVERVRQLRATRPGVGDTPTADDQVSAPLTAGVITIDD